MGREKGEDPHEKRGKRRRMQEKKGGEELLENVLQAVD